MQISLLRIPRSEPKRGRWRSRGELPRPSEPRCVQPHAQAGRSENQVPLSPADSRTPGIPGQFSECKLRHLCCARITLLFTPPIVCFFSRDVVGSRSSHTQKRGELEMITSLATCAAAPNAQRGSRGAPRGALKEPHGQNGSNGRLLRNLFITNSYFILF